MAWSCARFTSDVELAEAGLVAEGGAEETGRSSMAIRLIGLNAGIL